MMDDAPEDRLITAIGRIERALSRLERASAAPPPDPRYAGLVVRHERLREQAGAALARIDQLLESEAG